MCEVLGSIPSTTNKSYGQVSEFEPRLLHLPTGCSLHLRVDTTALGGRLRGFKAKTEEKNFNVIVSPCVIHKDKGQ